MNLLIYSPQSSARLEYILDVIFNNILPCDYECTNDLIQFKKSPRAKLNYSNETIKDGLHIIPSTLLFENTIHPQVIDPFIWKEKTAFFKTSDHEIPFDLLASSFYLISRYEEYLTLEKDEFDRFPHVQSLAFKQDFLDKPLIDEWLLELKKIILTHYPKLVFKNKQFNFIPTYDIDIAYSYKHKGLLRNAGGALRDVRKGNWKALKSRIQVLSNSTLDPFDSFDFLDDLHTKYNLAPIYFFLLGSGGPLDKNLSSDQPQFRKLIKTICSKYATGIHPSYRSNNETNELNKEINRLNDIASAETTKSRQHYIKFELPHTYRRLLHEGILEDYSMGYGSTNGFRASTASPFFWFDLEQNHVTSLNVFPFCFMECNSFFEQKQGIQDTLEEVTYYIHKVHQVRGTFISIWHNFSLGTDALWNGWAQLYEDQIKTIKKLSQEDISSAT